MTSFTDLLGGAAAGGAPNTQRGSLDQGLVVLFDGHAMFHRAFHAIKTPLSVSHSGEPTTAVFGVASSLLRVLSQMRPQYAAVAFDVSGPTFRHEMYEPYKAQRPPMPDEMRAQFGRVREAVGTFGLPIVEIAGFEADDVLGHVARHATERGLRTVIVTGDQDTMQLVSPTVSILYQRGAQSETIYDPPAVLERYGLAPYQIPDLKALQGDPSDNIRGVPGVGSKTATTLLQQYDTVAGIYQNLDEITPAGLQKRLRDGNQAALQSLDLTRIVTELPLNVSFDDLVWTERFDHDRLVAWCRELEFTSLIPRIPALSAATGSAAGPAPAPPDSVDTAYRTVSTLENLEEVLAGIGAAMEIAVTTPTAEARLVDVVPAGIALAWAPGEAAYVPILDQTMGSVTPSAQTLVDRLREFLENGPGGEPRPLIVHVARETLTPLANLGITATGAVWDTSVAAHLLGKPSTALAPLALSEFGHEMPTMAQMVGTGAKVVPFHAVDTARATDYACAAADHVLRMKSAWAPLLREQGADGLFDDLEMPLAPVLIRMERNGIRLDRPLLSHMSGEMHSQVERMAQDIYEMAGAGAGLDEPLTFNLNSPQQLGDVLFNKLGLPARKRTQKGYSTDASVLEWLANNADHHRDVVARILEYRELSKLVSTYVDALPKEVNERTKRIHTSFNQTGSATGRIASQDPNLQNIPVRTETGRRIREAFTAPEGSKLVAADYSQIELRILAHLADDPNLKAAFADGEDIHASTASQVLGIHPEAVTSDHRRIAKAVNFGIVYGMSGFGLAARLDMDRKAADAFIDAYFIRYPNVRGYMDRTIEQARSMGYVQTLLGRRRYLPEIAASNPNVRAGAERMAINMPVQGTAADIIKLAMLRMQEQLDGTGLRTLMLLQIHDELLFEAPEDEMGPLRAIVDEVMPAVMPLLDVPLVVDVKSGPSWGAMA